MTTTKRQDDETMAGLRARLRRRYGRCSLFVREPPHHEDATRTHQEGWEIRCGRAVGGDGGLMFLADGERKPDGDFRWEFRKI
jgi:hypothetical protein